MFVILFVIIIINNCNYEWVYLYISTLYKPLRPHWEKKNKMTVDNILIISKHHLFLNSFFFLTELIKIKQTNKSMFMKINEQTPNFYNALKFRTTYTLQKTDIPHDKYFLIIICTFWENLKFIDVISDGKFN